MSELSSFTCILCWRTSYNPNDVREGFCGRCHQYVPGVVIRDVPNMAGWRYAEALGSPDWRLSGSAGNLWLAIRPDGALYLGTRDGSPSAYPVIDACDVQNWINLFTAANQELRRRGRQEVICAT